MNANISRCGCFTVTNMGWNSADPVTRTILCEMHATMNRNRKVEEYGEKLKEKQHF